MMRPLAFTRIALLVALFSGSVAEATLYRWVDENGHVQFTDRIPPNEVNRSRETLNEEGLPTAVIDRAKTREEVERDREIERLRAEQKKLIEQQQAANQVLLRTFRNEDDMILSRNGKLDAIEVGIQVAQGSVRRYQTKLTDLQRKAARLELSREGATATHAALNAEIQDTLKRINETYVLIRGKEQDQQGIRDTFERDLKRFRTLKNLAPGQQVVEDRKFKPLDNLLPCGAETPCEQAWGRAETFVRKHATTPMQILGENIIMSGAPLRDTDISITISRIQERGGGTPVLFMDLFCKDSPLGKELCASPKVTAVRQAYRQEVGLMAAP
jgi:hypothetical protein